MKRAACLALLAASLAGCHGPSPQIGEAVPPELPDWTGLWETEAAAGLLAEGRFTAPGLWHQPPYNAQWAASLGKPADGVRLPPTDLPPATKVCEPSGFPANMEQPVADLLFELLLTRQQVLLVSTDGAIRHIYTDGRPHPAPEDLWPTAQGHSIGHWEGDTLVVETIARKAGPVGPVPEAASLSERARFTERIRRLDADTLQNEMTIDDAERLSRPWQLRILYKRVREVDRMIPVDCNENDRNPVVDGQLLITAP